jgi:wobble nucleotide-excising tRNase
MIESVEIAGVATYGDVAQKLHQLSKFNFVYGANGSGKTTVSRVLADEANHPTCRVSWRSGTKLQVMAYNRDFVDKNFGASTELKGIFTLGEENSDSIGKVVIAKAELMALTTSIERFKAALVGEVGLVGKHPELATLENQFKEKCFAQKRKHDAKFATAFEGHRNSTESFKSKVLQELALNNAALKSFAELELRAVTIFGPTPVAEQLISSVDFSTLTTHLQNPILKKKVLGKDDVDISAMIRKLGNSDWVRQGRAFFEVNDSICPFCQQATEDSFANSLTEYFDETFVADSKAIDSISEAYAADAQRADQRLLSIIAASPKFLDVEVLRAERDLLDSRNVINIQRLAQKKREPSQIVELEELTNVIAAICKLIEDTNAKATAHNETVANLAQERRALASQVWRYLLDVELKAELADYGQKKVAIGKAISSLNEKIQLAETNKRAKLLELSVLEKAATSIQPTIDDINSMLASFGFRGFSLGKAANGTCYRLKRHDDKDAKETLSEGEKTFVTFLYFYHLLKGSVSESGITADRIVVFDDPVSSLDSDILFIVGSLVKELLEQVRNGTTNVKQVFVLTHNVYFHKEVTFNKMRRDGGAMTEETFWVVRKSGLNSTLERHPSNPVRTSYDLLWSELRTPNRSNLTIQNVLRRILESYFKILGDINFEEICAKFEGLDRVTCKSLFSWINDGSHFAHDDLYVAVEDSMVERYLIVFRAIFQKSGHEAHYKMMMGSAGADVPEDAVAA